MTLSSAARQDNPFMLNSAEYYICQILRLATPYISESATRCEEILGSEIQVDLDIKPKPRPISNWPAGIGEPDADLTDGLDVITLNNQKAKITELVRTSWNNLLKVLEFLVSDPVMMKFMVEEAQFIEMEYEKYVQANKDNPEQLKQNLVDFTKNVLPKRLAQQLFLILPRAFKALSISYNTTIKNTASSDDSKSSDRYIANDTYWAICRSAQELLTVVAPKEDQKIMRNIRSAQHIKDPAKFLNSYWDAIGRRPAIVPDIVERTIGFVGILGWDIVGFFTYKLRELEHADYVQIEKKSSVKQAITNGKTLEIIRTLANRSELVSPVSFLSPTVSQEQQTVINQNVTQSAPVVSSMHLPTPKKPTYFTGASSTLLSSTKAVQVHVDGQRQQLQAGFNEGQRQQELKHQQDKKEYLSQASSAAKQLLFNANNTSLVRGIRTMGNLGAQMIKNITNTPK